MRVFVAMPLGKKEVTGIRKAIRVACSAAKFESVFPDEIEKSHKITQSIIDEIRGASVVICEISNRNPNVIWEYGFASSVGKPVIPISHTTKALFFDNKDDRAIIYDPEKLTISLTQKLTNTLDDISRGATSFPASDLIGTTKYPRAVSVMGLETIGNSDMGIFDLMRKGRSRIFAAAQNHWFVVQHMEKFKNELVSFLREDKRRTFDFLMCDSSVKHAVRTWQFVTSSEYRDHLERSTTAFTELQRWAAGRKDVGPRLRIRKTDVVPFSITFVDPDEKDGFFVLTPNGYEKLNKPRPCFIVSRLNGDHIFQQYYSSYSHILEI